MNNILEMKCNCFAVCTENFNKNKDNGLKFR